MTQVHAILEGLRRDPAFLSCVSRWETIERRSGSYAPFPDDIDPELARVFADRGIEKLYTHQLQAYRAVRNGKNLLVVTPTASGKTLCYNLPVLQGLLEDPEAKGLYIFPTKALAQDQQAELNGIILSGPLPLKVATYDGDTPQSSRVAARDTGRIIITNPAILHSGILPNHPKWIRFLGRLSYIVIDEIHIYRGVFGSHMTNLIRRLKRITEFYGSRPLFILCSATIGNPEELARRILEEDVETVDENGAPSGEKHVILYNPPLVDRVQGIRRGVVLESRRLAVRFLEKGVKTIVFARSRVNTELIAGYINRTLASFFTDNHRIRVESYRGGYLPNERRKIEQGLRDGSIQGVVSTNALELGIDIGGLDVSILAGFPGSIASTWQQAGRAGRRNTTSLVILVASAAPVDQYLITHPDYLFGASPESAYIDPDNLFILMAHLKCALFELPFKAGSRFGGPVDELLSYLEEEGGCRYAEGTYYWADRSYPAEQVSLRSASNENVVIIDVSCGGGGEVIGEMDRPSAKEMLFEGAVYIHRGEQYMVTRLDIANKRCEVRPCDGNFYTDGIVKRDIKILHRDLEEERMGMNVILGDILVRSQVTKFKKIRFASHENIGYGDIFLPEEEMHTRALACVFDGETAAGRAFQALPEMTREQVMAGIGTLVQNVSPFFLLCDKGDIGVAERLRDPELDLPALFIYDSCPGGTGLSEGFLDRMPEIFAAAFELVSDCPCERGCPSCIGPDDGKGGLDNRKAGVIAFLACLLGRAHA